MAFIELDDLSPFADIEPIKALEMIDDATALATLAAPCLGVEADLTVGQKGAVKAILRGAILRWNDAGSGALQAEQVGAYSYSTDNRQARKGMFWPSEITQLQNICAGNAPSGAFAVDTYAVSPVVHADVCAYNFGALYCSCGASLTLGGPLYEITYGP